MKPKQNLIGRTFHRLTVISEEKPIGYSKRWLCKCECGNEKIIYQNALCRGATKSCGCYSKEQVSKRRSKGWASVFTKEFLEKEHIEKKKSLREIAKENGCTVSCIIRYMKKYELKANDKLQDLTGEKFEMLTVLSYSHSKHSSAYWNVQCDCGKKITVQKNCLVRHQQVSCGCYNKNKEWEGHEDLSKTYWSRLYYGAFERNLSFEISIEYAWNLFEKQNKICALSGVPLVMDRQYSQNHGFNKKQTASLDRIDSNKGYIVGNVQWVHLTVNKMKSNLIDQDFIDWCTKIANNSKQRLF